MYKYIYMFIYLFILNLYVYISLTTAEKINLINTYLVNIDV